jgi:predicted nucleic acid-binding protein
VGTVLDTTVFIDLERAVRPLPAANAMAEVSGRLEGQLGPDEEVAIAAITASELLHGVHRAIPEHRARREAFVEAVISAFPPLPFDLLAARTRASGPTSPLPGRTLERTTGSSLRPPFLPDGVSGGLIAVTLTGSPGSTCSPSPSPASSSAVTAPPERFAVLGCGAEEVTRPGLRRQDWLA